MGAKVLKIRRSVRFKDMTIVGEGPEDVAKIVELRARADLAREAHEQVSRRLPHCMQRRMGVWFVVGDGDGRRRGRARFPNALG